MTNEELVSHLEGLGHTAETLDLGPQGRWIVVRDYPISTGTLAGQRRDVAVQWSPQVPYVAPSAVQVRPHVVPMGTRNAQGSPLGPEWQYLSRVLRCTPTPQALDRAHQHHLLGAVMEEAGPTEISVAMTAATDADLRRHLDKGLRQEDLTFATWRPSTGRRRTTAVLSGLLLPHEGERILQGNVAFTADYAQRALGELQPGEGLALVHCHLGPGWQDMSNDDVVAERDRLAGAAFGAPGSIAARGRDLGDRRVVERPTVAADRPQAVRARRRHHGESSGATAAAHLPSRAAPGAASRAEPGRHGQRLG